ncbi:FMN-binding protein [Phycicoccus duodecadis]|uniref:Uncharacterized protein with FMN-binding domain n=1 Tax=Phycicoccus duodecadis TaxID=173053 RepID=A0A2N3YG33_9MICO|nr:FMN-binding protein [Phycicoccus duodecadis]PKW25822.1 uncharacterized protein with FMN-binding domain [Phycicoccus duodecadis]
MRRITTWVLSTVSALVLLFSYHTSTNAAGTTSIVAAGGTAANGTSPGAAGGTGSTATPGTAPPDTTGTGSTATPSTPSTSSGSSGSSGSSAAKTYTGDAVDTRYGPVQVAITVAGGKVTRSVVTQVPWNGRQDQEINSYAVPVLNGEVVAAQSAGIDMVSGATFTSDGYIRSLQSALDQAHL